MSETPHTCEEILTAAERVSAQLGVKRLTIQGGRNQKSSSGEVAPGGSLALFQRFFEE